MRVLIEGFPFTSEGYARAKSILIAKFGKPSEMAVAHIQCIRSLPVVSNLEFYEKLSVSVQALETVNELRDIKGYIKLRTDLVRMDDVWQEWGFPKLVESLQMSTDRNPNAINISE